MGDSADHIKGAEKIGVKTAVLLLNEFGDFANILEYAEKIAKPSVKQSILKYTEQLKMNYKMIKLNGGEPLPLELNELEYNVNGISTNGVLKGIELI